MNNEYDKKMEQWIPFGEGEYWVEQAYLMTPKETAVALEETILEIYTGKNGLRYMRGNGKVQNILVVNLLEDDDILNLLLDLGDEFKYLMENPDLHAGKVFSPHVKAVMKFNPKKQWRQLSIENFEDLVSRLQRIDV